ncbi:MAG: hypothetical protein U1E65_28845 [Myxococcota bacterium]
MRLHLSVALLVLAACGSSAMAPIPLPDDVRWLTAVLETKERAPLAATELMSAQAVNRLTTEDLPAPRLLVLGYLDQDILDLGVAPDPSERLRIATDADPWLPHPSFAASGLRDGDRFALGIEEASVELPHLTASWLPRCPSKLKQRIVLDQSCRPSLCSPTYAQDGCTLHVDAERCGAGSLDLDVGPHGELSPSASSSRCTALPPALDAALSLRCTAPACELSFYDREATPPVSATVLPINEGHVYGTADTSGHIVTVKLRGGVANCASQEGSANFYDAPSEKIIGTSSTPPCVTRLVGEQVLGGFYALVQSPPQIAWINSKGMARQVRALDPRATVATGLALSDGVLAISALGGDQGGIIELRSADDLRSLGAQAIPGTGAHPSQPVAIALLSGGRGAVLDGAAGVVHVFRFGGGGVQLDPSPTAIAGQPTLSSTVGGALLAIDDLLTVGWGGSVQRLDLRTTPPTATGPFRRPIGRSLGDPTAMAPLGRGILIGFSGPQASLLYFDGEHLGRGVLSLGPGAIYGGTVDHEEHVWFALPDVQGLAKVSAR